MFERAITFDGPDVHSVPLPLRGSVLSGRIEKICNEIVRHVTEVTADASNTDLGVGRMVVNFKVDGNGKIWILWTDSIRLESKHSADSTSSQPINMNTVVKLPSATKLTQIPSHDTALKLENKLPMAKCPSCGKCDTNENFQDVSYNTVISHFEKAMDMFRSVPESNPSKIWPPEKRFVKAAGTVGFGTANKQVKPNEALVIPPVLRQCHPKLQVRGYQMYRNDPLFLQKTCNVCEDCFLAYAKLRESLYLMVPPASLPKDDFHYDVSVEMCKVENSKDTVKRASDKRMKESTIDQFDFKDFGKAPEMPPAILEPPQVSDLTSCCSLVPLSF